MTCVLSLESVPWGRTLASGFNQTYTNQRRPLIPHQPWPCPWVTVSATDAEPGSQAPSEEREPRLEDTCWGDDRWTPWDVTVCRILAGASCIGVSRSYRADVHCSVCLVNNSKHEKSTEKLITHWILLFPMVLFPSPWFITKSNDTSVMKAVKNAHGAAMTMESPGEGGLLSVQ